MGGGVKVCRRYKQTTYRTGGGTGQDLIERFLEGRLFYRL